MMEAQDLRKVLRTALIHAFMMRGFAHERAAELAEIALGPCLVTMELAQRIIQLNAEAAAMHLHSAAEKEGL